MKQTLIPSDVLISLRKMFVEAPLSAEDEQRLNSYFFERQVPADSSSDVDDDAAFIAAAKKHYDPMFSDGDLDWDDDPIVSDSEEGAFVNAWLWVPREEIQSQENV